VIELRHITKSYRTGAGRNVVLDDVSARFEAGEGVGILGGNGAGKSTLLRILGGAEMPDEGEVIRRGRVSWPLGFQGGFNSSLSGEENCRFVARIYGQDVDRVIDETVDFAELGEYFYMPVRTYSSGMRARLAFGVSMAIDFDAYLIDEVIAVGDKRFRRKCRQMFKARQSRAAMIMVSHQMSTIRTYCRRCGVLWDGKLTMYDSVDEAAAAYEEKAAA
jgi:capsular polysaccharide transport system ATP-binding protein